jgi:Fungal specific transcription factor domain
LFKNDQEKRYFQVFSTQTASQLTGLFSSDVWTRLILQTCETHPSIRHAIIAIGALDPKTWRSPAKTQEETSRRQFAYHEYSLAIADMRRTISEGKFDLRTKLIACIVCVCFEIYHYNKLSAFAQIRAMSLLIEEQEQRAPLNIDEEALEAFNELQIQSLIHGRYGQVAS